MNNKEIIYKEDIHKYRIIVDTIRDNIRTHNLSVGASLPSINELCDQYTVSRKTAIAAYRELKSLGIARSSPRKGYYVASEKGKSREQIFLFLDEFSGFKETLYNGFKDGIGRKGNIEIFFHHFHPAVYERTIRESIGYYTAFVIMPIHQLPAANVIKEIPESKLFILDTGLFPFGKKYPSVCQNFEKDIIATLNSGMDLLRKYDKLILVYPGLAQTQEGTLKGFQYFCHENKFKNECIRTTEGRKIKKGEAYIVISDNDLVQLVHASGSAGFRLGKDIGILSCNDTPLKPIVANGITTMSTDFRLMGMTMADMVLNRKRDQVENPCYLIRRGSL